jgi:hypothetical protein
MFVIYFAASLIYLPALQLADDHGSSAGENEGEVTGDRDRAPFSSISILHMLLSSRHRNIYKTVSRNRGTRRTKNNSILSWEKIINA